MFKNLTDFINRVDPKDINKLQLEGLVKAGAFDKFNSNRKSLFNSIPNIILKSKNNFENNLTNQINLFNDDVEDDNDYLEKTEDWNFENRLFKEFESLGFYISGHPLNQYKAIFDQYNIVSYDDFNINENFISSNIACTVLKIQEKKTQKGNSYAIVKFSDLSSVFELFLFSDIFEMNRELLKEGNSIMITLIKNFSDENKVQKKINVKKIISLKDVLNKPLEEVKIEIKNIDELDKLKLLNKGEGKTKVTINFIEDNKTYIFQLKKKRKLDNKLINSLKISENVKNN